MSYYPKITHYAFWKPETAFRTNAHGLDAANQAGDTYYYLPVTDAIMGQMRPMKNRTAEPVSGRLHYGYIHLGDYQAATFTLTGNLRDGTMLKHMLNPSTYSETPNTPSSGYYTRSMREDQPTNPYSFEMLLYNVNPDSGESVITVLHGCTIQSSTISGNSGSQVQVSLNIGFATSVAGVALTSLPTIPHMRSYDYGQAVVTWSVSGSPKNISVYDWSISIDNSVTYDQPTGNPSPVRVVFGDRKWSVKMTVAHMDKDFWSDTIETADPSVDDDLDITIKIARDTTYDYIQFAFEKMWVQSYEQGRYSYNNFYLQHTYTFIMKPTSIISDAKCTTTEVINVGYPA